MRRDQSGVNILRYGLLYAHASRAHAPRRAGARVQQTPHADGARWAASATRQGRPQSGLRYSVPKAVHQRPGGAEVWDSGRIGSPRGSGALNEGIDGYPMIATMRRPAEARSAGRAQAQRGSRAAGDTAGDAGSLASRRGTISLVHRSETPGAPVSTHPFRRCVPPSSPQPLADSPVRALALVAVRAFALAMHALAMCGGGCARLIACRARLVAATGSAAIALALGTVAGRPSMRGRLSWRTVPSLAALALARLAFALRVELGAPLARLAAALARARRRWCPSDRRVRVAARGG